jgi:hypothetical protein
MMKFVIWFTDVTAVLTGVVIASGVDMAIRRAGSGSSVASYAEVG